IVTRNSAPSLPRSVSALKYLDGKRSSTLRSCAIGVSFRRGDGVGTHALRAEPRMDRVEPRELFLGWENDATRHVLDKLALAGIKGIAARRALASHSEPVVGCRTRDGIREVVQVLAGGGENALERGSRSDDLTRNVG